MPVVPAVERLKQRKRHELEASLSNWVTLKLPRIVEWDLISK